MRIRAAVFDVDGTLVPHGAPCPSEATAAALRALQEKHIPVIIASGRARYTAQAVLGSGIRPDYFAAANGCDVTDAENRSLWSSRMTQAEMDALVSFCAEHRIPLEFIFSDAYYAYISYEIFREEYEGSGTETKGIAEHLRNGEDRTRHLRDMPFAACTTIAAQDMEAFQSRFGALGLRFVCYEPHKYDILRADADKSVGVAHLLEHLGISWADTAVFGDSDNDAGLFRRAGFSVAMGDGTPEIRAMAHVVSAPAAQDGVARAVQAHLL